MSTMKEIKMSQDEILDSCQKLVLSGRCMLDAMEELCGLFMKVSTRAESPGPGETTADGLHDGTTAEPAERPDSEGVRMQETRTAEKAECANMAYQEEVRGKLAELARKGYRAEVKQLLARHGVKKLSDLTDPEDLAQLAAEAKLFGCLT